MIFAARKLQGIGLIMLVTFCFLIAYPISLRVSATRAELMKVEQQIAAAQQRNRMLEGDIAVLANARQLDRWNADYFGYAMPSEGQYLQGERALASLDRLRAPSDMRVQPQVLTAMATPTTAPQAGASVREAAETRGVQSVPNGLARASTGPALPAPIRSAGLRQPAAEPRQQRLAMLDRAELASSTLRDIAQSVASTTGNAGR